MTQEILIGKIIIVLMAAIIIIGMALLYTEIKKLKSKRSKKLIDNLYKQIWELKQSKICLREKNEAMRKTLHSIADRLDERDDSIRKLKQVNLDLKNEYIKISAYYIAYVIKLGNRIKAVDKINGELKDRYEAVIDKLNTPEAFLSLIAELNNALESLFDKNGGITELTENRAKSILSECAQHIRELSTIVG